MRETTILAGGIALGALLGRPAAVWLWRLVTRATRRRPTDRGGAVSRSWLAGARYRRTGGDR